MKKIIILGALGFLVWYGYKNYKTQIKGLIAPLIPGATDPVTGAVTPVNDRDKEVLAMINEIMAAEESYSTTAEYKDAITRLQNSLLPVAYNCLVAPCPPAQQVSDSVRERVNMIIGILNQNVLQLQNSGTSFYK